MPGSATSPLPFTITRPRENDTGRVRRTVGFSITCPDCGERKIAITRQLALAWRYSHICEEH
jgi:hypothetical protein